MKEYNKSGIFNLPLPNVCIFPELLNKKPFEEFTEKIVVEIE